MLNQIKHLTEEYLTLSATAHSSDEDLQLAEVVLILEMIYMDDKLDFKEQEIILTLIQQTLALTVAPTKS